jgi:hypothetical protein
MYFLIDCDQLIFNGPETQLLVGSFHAWPQGPQGPWGGATENSKKLKSKNNNKNYFLEKGVLNFKLKKNQKKSNGMSSIGYLGRFFETARSTAW